MACLPTMSRKQLAEIRQELIQVLEMNNGSMELSKVFGAHHKFFKKTVRVKKYGLSTRRLASINADVMEVVPTPGKKSEDLLKLKNYSPLIAEQQIPLYNETVPAVTRARPIRKKTPNKVTKGPTEMLKECLEGELTQLLKQKKKGLKIGQLANAYKAQFCNNLRVILEQCRITNTVEAIAGAFKSKFALEKEKATRQSKGKNKLQLRRRLKALDATVIILQQPSSPCLYPNQNATTEGLNLQDSNSQTSEGNRKRPLPLADKKSKGKKKLKKSLSEETASNVDDTGYVPLETASECPTNDIGSDILATSEGQLQQQQQQQCMTRRPQRYYQFHCKEDVLAQCFITNLARANELVTVHRVMELLLQHYHVSNVQELGLHYETVLPAIDRLVKLQIKVNAFIQAFVKVRAVCTLYELRECLANVDLHHCRPTWRDFADLELGPLTKQPLVWEYFRFPASKGDADIPRITTMDVMKEFRDCLTERNLWSDRLELADFMEYLITKYDVREPLELGLRITSITILTNAVKTATKQTKSTMAEVQKKLKPHVVTLVNESIAEINKIVMSPAKLKGHSFTIGPELEVRHQYVNMKAAHAVRAVFDNACRIGYLSSQLRGLCRSLERVMADPMSCSLFQLAVCCGDLSRPDDLPEGIVVKAEETEEEMGEKNSSPAEASPGASQPTLDQVKQELMCHLDQLQHGINLKDLAHIETEVCQHFGFQNFQSLSRTERTFLEFLSIDHPEVLDGVSGGLMAQMGHVTGNSNRGSLYRPSRLDLVEFIRQCDPHKESQGTVDRCLCAHYQVSTVKKLGHGQLNRLSQPLIKMAATLGHNQQDSNAVIYETALCATNRRKKSKSKAVGLFGSQGEEDALLCLQSAPLLEDLAEWCHWTMVFEPEHGDLKAFLERNLGLTLSPPIRINALEVRPGVLLRLSAETSNDLFAAAAKSGDSINTVGHLVSLVVKDGPSNVPFALLSNHMETALNMMGAASDHGAVVGFILECLVAVPLQIGQVVVRQVFLNPLVNVLGSEVKSRQLILASCKTTAQKSRIQSLGLLLGIGQWKDSFLEERMPRNMDNQQDLSGDGEEEFDVSNFLSLKKSHQAEERPPKVEENHSVTSICDDTSIDLEKVGEGENASCVQALRKQEPKESIQKDAGVKKLKELDEKVERETLNEEQEMTAEVIEKKSKDILADVKEEEVHGHIVKVVHPVQAKPVQAKPVQAKPDQAEPVQAEPVQAKPVQAKPVQDKPESNVAATSQDVFEDEAAIYRCSSQSGSYDPTFKLNKGDFLSRRAFCSLNEWPPPKRVLQLFSSQAFPYYPLQPKERLSVDGLPQEETQSTAINCKASQDGAMEQSSPAEQGGIQQEETQSTAINRKASQDGALEQSSPTEQGSLPEVETQSTTINCRESQDSAMEQGSLLQ